MISIQLSRKVTGSDCHIFLIEKHTNLSKINLSKEETTYVKKSIDKNIDTISTDGKLIVVLSKKSSADATNEDLRRKGSGIVSYLNEQKCAAVAIINETGTKEAGLSFAEGLALGAYQFIKYKKEKDKEATKLKTVTIIDETISKETIDELNVVIDAVYKVRNLVNEPVNHLNAPKLAKEFEKMGKEAGFRTEIFDRKKIESLRMGGLLSVNQGSIDPPRFTIMEWKPKNAKNKKPIILVGKGVVYDTGGLSLKPTQLSMDYMKTDMAGAATVAGIMYVAAKTKLPLHLVALAPSTDNRLSGNAFAPGDIITMYDGTTVEMLNSDAEGRMILADALSYAKKYDPQLVIDMATLTGAAAAAIGKEGIVYMSTAPKNVTNELEESGEEKHERLVRFPLWDEYGDYIKSDIADMKNVGGKNAGAITAGKFLEKFTSYPWIHLDIAGVAFLHGADGYKGKNATAFGLRLIYNFLQKQVKNAGKQ